MIEVLQQLTWFFLSSYEVYRSDYKFHQSSQESRWRRKPWDLFVEGKFIALKPWVSLQREYVLLPSKLHWKPVVRQTPVLPFKYTLGDVLSAENWCISVWNASWWLTIFKAGMCVENRTFVERRAPTITRRLLSFEYWHAAVEYAAYFWSQYQLIWSISHDRTWPHWPNLSARPLSPSIGESWDRSLDWSKVAQAWGTYFLISILVCYTN